MLRAGEGELRAPSKGARRRTERVRTGRELGRTPHPRGPPGLQLLVRNLSPACWAVARDMWEAAPSAGPTGTAGRRLGIRTGASQEGWSECGRQQRPQAPRRLSRALVLSMLLQPTQPQRPPGGRGGRSKVREAGGSTRGQGRGQGSVGRQGTAKRPSSLLVLGQPRSTLARVSD